MAHSGVALFLLLATTALSVYKPRDMTRYGQRKQREKRRKQHAVRRYQSEPEQGALVPSQ